MTPMPASPFMNSVAPSPAAIDTAAADQVAPQVAAAEPIADPDGGYMGQRLSPALGTSVGTAVASKPPPAADATAASISDDQDVPARMQESKARQSGLARDDEKPGDTMQESRPAHPATASSETDCISEIFFYARKLMKQPPRFVLDQARFLAEIEEVPMFLREDGYMKRQA